MYYFAYGSSMEHHRLLVEICPGARFLGPVLLDDYCLIFDGYSAPWGGPVANIDVSPGDVVCGGLFEITAENLAALDTGEGYPRYYSRREVEVRDLAGSKRFTAQTYVRDPQPTGLPAKKYMMAVIKGARDCGLPEEYIHTAFDHYMRKYT
ncbi:MAG: gamma-glutamylcyclotransferase family protein [Candidatus Omnitrophota bacterium]